MAVRAKAETRVSIPYTQITQAIAEIDVTQERALRCTASINLRHTDVQPHVPVISPAPTPFKPKQLHGRNRHCGSTSPNEPFTMSSTTTR